MGIQKCLLMDDTTISRRQATQTTTTDPTLQMLLNAENIAVCFFDKVGDITCYSRGFDKLLLFRKDFFAGKNLAGLPFSKIDEMLGFPHLDSRIADFQIFKAVKFINGHGQISNIDVHLTVARSGEEVTGGSILLEKTAEINTKERAHQNLLSKSQFYLKEPLRISSVFANMLKESIDTDQKTQAQEYVYYVSKNLKKLNRLLDHLVFLENLNFKTLKISNVNLEISWLLELQKAKKEGDAPEPKITMNEFPATVSGDKELIRKMLNLIIEFATLYPGEKEEKFIEFSGETAGDFVKLYFVFNSLDFIDHPKFAPSQPLNKVVDLNNMPVSGYELVLIRQIIQAHGGDLEIQLMKNGNSLMKITLPDM